MKTIPTNLWLKPFAPPISCINTIHAECQRSISLDECIELCEKNPGCNAGYHVTVKDTETGRERCPNFCVPLNTYSWVNTSLFNNLIPSSNPTRLSSDKGVISTVFYNEKKFNDPSQDLVNNAIPSGAILYLITRDKKGNTLFMDSEFHFTPQKKNGQKLTIDLNYSRTLGYQHRIGKGTVIKLQKGKSQLVLGYSKHLKKFNWITQSVNTRGIYFKTRNENDRYQFVNLGDSFQLLIYKMDQPLYFILNNQNILDTTTSDKQSDNQIFQFTLAEKPYDPSLSIANMKRNQPLWESMNQFIDRYFPSEQMTPSHAEKKDISTWLLVDVIIFILLIVCWILHYVVLWWMNRGNGKSKTKKK